MRPLLFIVAACLLATPALAAKPNILFAISDDQSFPHAGAYGTSWVKTPGFDRVAREGLLFNNAYTPNAKCAPSRACIMTGRNSWQLEEAANHMPYFPAKFTAFPEALAKRGYFVGETGKTWSPGVAKDAAGKSRQLGGKPWEKRKAKPPAGAISSNDYAANFDDFLDAAPRDQPFCFWYGSTEPHRRYEYGVGVRKGGKKLADIDKVPAFWPDSEQVRNDMLDYAFEIEHFDDHLVRMLTSLERRGLLDNTLVIVTSDNGMPFPRVKGQKYELSNHLPLAVMWPKGITKPGRKIDDYVSFIDFAPTIFEAAGIDAGAAGMQPMSGRSLVEIFRSEKAGRVIAERDHVLIGKERHDAGRPNDWGYPVRGIVKDGWLYLKNYETGRWPGGDPITGYLNCDGSPTKTQILGLRRSGENTGFWQQNFGKRPAEELFDVRSDQDCVKNLAAVTDHHDRMDALRTQMEKELNAQGDPRMSGRGDVFDNYPIATGSAKFYERMIEKNQKVKAGWVNAGDFEKEPLD